MKSSSYSYLKVQKILVIILFANIAVATSKVIYGYIISSISMIADGFHSMFDGVSNVIGLIGIWIAKKPPDKEHPYGHKKYETYASLGIAILLLLTCIEILENTYKSFLSKSIPKVTEMSFAIMLITIAINLIVTTYEYKKGKELKSDILIADSMHTRSDILTSFSVIVSLMAVRIGYPILDPIVALIIALLIGKSGLSIIKQSSDILCDTSILDTNKIKNIVESIDGIQNCHNIRTRGREDAIFIDLHITVNPNLHTDKAHELSKKVEKELLKMEGVTDVVVHIEPDSDAMVAYAPIIDSNEIKNIVRNIDGILDCHNIRIIGNGDKIHLDLHIIVNPDLQTDKAHELSKEVEKRLLKEKGITDVVVHIEPDNNFSSSE